MTFENSGSASFHNTVGIEIVEPAQELVAPIMQLTQRGEFGAAAGAVEALIAQYPNSLLLCSLAVLSHAQIGNTAQAEKHARHAVFLSPNDAPGHHNLGLVLRTQRRVDESLAAFTRAVELDSNFTAAHFYRGLMFYRKAELDGALLSFDQVVRLQPDDAAAHYYRGAVLTARGEQRAAVAAFSEAIRVRPGFAEAHNDKGVVLLALTEWDAALSEFEEAIRLKPDFALAHENMATVLCSKKELGASLEAVDRALVFDFNLRGAASLKFYLKSQICDFAPTPGLAVETFVDGTTPLGMLSLEDSPERQMARSVAHGGRRTLAIRPLPLPARPQSRPSRLRIGYFSSDFHDHATLRLMSGLIREHDRSRFEIFIYSYGLGRTGLLRENLQSDDLNFHDVQSLADPEIVRMARLHNLDIAIDLKGYTSDSRSDLFAYRLAPIQINYLGYPGTMGSPSFDYIVADSTVIPAEQRPYYSESVLYLPDTYQPNDNKRAFEAAPTSRADFGLPENAFVFCCFNNSFKIGEREFDIWMRVLREVEDSVLWLLRSNIWMEKNLRDAAASQGISPDRLIFSDKIDYAGHLERHRHANLMLDTFNYNAHTTTSDALWTCLPIVTKVGQQFSARVAASLLNAARLSELVTKSDEEYGNKILALATRPKKLKRICKHLETNRLKTALFDTERYTRNFEAGLQMAYDRYFEGKSPADIVIPDQSRKLS